MQKIEEKKSKRQAVLFSFLTLILLAGVILLGIPSLIKMAVFLSNLRSSGQSVEANDTVAPAPPRLQPMVEATDSAQISLKGFAESGSTVKVSRGNEEISEVLVDKDGQFTVSEITLKTGENKFKAQAVDSGGNQSKFSPTITIVLDTTAPSLSISQPEEGQEFFDEEKEILIAGETEEGINLRVNSFYTPVDSEGNFAKRLELDEGENEIKIIATDRAGNTSEANLTVRYTP